MHHEFYLDEQFINIEQINSIFSEGHEIKKYLSTKALKCGYHKDCQAILIPVILGKNNLVYLRSKKKSDHLPMCPFHDLSKLKQKLINNKNLAFLIKNWPKRSVNKNQEEFDKLIASKYQGTYITLAELFDLLKNDSDLNFLKVTSFINPEYCAEWYEKSHSIENNAVLLTGKLNRKFYSCKLGKNCHKNYDCSFNHEPKDYKLEIIEKDIEFHISVTKEIYDTIKDNGVEQSKMYHILAIINEMKNSNSKKKRFYTKHGKEVNHVIKNKKFVELIEN